jgi:NitT/TauT family transport system substrate-binding protein
MANINIMALRHSAFYSPLLTCIAGGYLKKQGLEPQYSVATPQKTVPDGIRNGSVHLAQSAVATSFTTLEKGEQCDIVHFAQINERDGFFIAARHPESEFNWNQLVGKEVLVDHFFQPMAMFRYALYKKGIAENQIHIIDAGNVDEIDRAFRQGQGDYVHQQGPAPQQMEKEGIAHVVASVGDAVGPVAFSSLCASREWLKTDMAQAFMQAYRESRTYTINAPAKEIAKLESKFFPEIDINVLANTIAAYQQLGCWTTHAEITQAAYENLLDVFMYSGIISKRYDYHLCVTAPPDSSTS